MMLSVSRSGWPDVDCPASAATSTPRPSCLWRHAPIIVPTWLLPSAQSWFFFSLKCMHNVTQTVSHACHTMRPEINSNDLGRLGIILQIRIRILSSWTFLIPNINSIFLRVRGSFTHYVTLHLHVLWPVLTRVLMCRNRCRHTADRHKQTTDTAQTHHTAIPTVVVFLMTHDNLLIAFWRRVLQVSDRR